MHDDDALRARERSLERRLSLAQPYPTCETGDELVLRAVRDACVGHDGTRITLGVGEAWPKVGAHVKRSQKIRRCRVGMRLTVCEEESSNSICSPSLASAGTAAVSAIYAISIGKRCCAARY